MINLPRIFRDKCLKSYINFCEVKEPCVVYSSAPDIYNKIFNYNQTINKDFTDLNDIDCICNKYCNFINTDCNHVATGDISIFTNSKLRNILKHGSGFREPVSLDFDKAL